MIFSKENNLHRVGERIRTGRIILTNKFEVCTHGTAKRHMGWQSEWDYHHTRSYIQNSH